MVTANTILNTATAEIGYSRWDDPKPGTKYGRAYAVKHGAGFGKNGVPFCALFITWVFHQAGINPPGGDFAYCPAGINAMKKLGLEVPKHEAKPGDIVFFDWDGGVSDHVGIVETNLGTTLQTIEGNTTIKGRTGCVGKRKRHLSTVCSVFRPQYGHTTTGNNPLPSASAAIEVDGYFGTQSIRRLQTVIGTPVDGLISSQPLANRQYVPNAAGGWEWVTRGAKGSTCIKAWQKRIGAAADGYFGRETVMKTQQFLGVPTDGYAGKQTMTAWQTWLNHR
ncbi:CHAP domain-containing protein [Mobiluncus curtisii]|uniref:Peptidase C51 domain-containing protein n=2 Tax=Mobiluncus curtisii TaxID=2051 RepID=D6ZGG5_MOBCV|nr:CHAP domain-containing protein [Mobiluncus curtisii]ADI67723.1 hypothetical protein HMPREF0573_11404 [Mobiluncus curtisii ATCC 43063]QQU08573.1 CHAP domain-containing protein [Mobiluncus curtisii]QQU08592.1 CHAP domain-containing protein [Mobiluncus curtisii]SQB64838.1 Putative peptidoglycan binding domain [Mobiluncus curtisii]